MLEVINATIFTVSSKAVLQVELRQPRRFHTRGVEDSGANDYCALARLTTTTTDRLVELRDVSTRRLEHKMNKTKILHMENDVCNHPRGTLAGRG